MTYLYILRSDLNSKRLYVGITNNLEKRIAEHNNPNEIGWTNRYAPWSLEMYMGFTHRSKAREMERYFKSHSGRAFLKSHLI